MSTKHGKSMPIEVTEMPQDVVWNILVTAVDIENYI